MNFSNRLLNFKKFQIVFHPYNKNSFSILSRKKAFDDSNVICVVLWNERKSSWKQIQNLNIISHLDANFTNKNVFTY